MNHAGAWDLSPPTTLMVLALRGFGEFHLYAADIVFGLFDLRFGVQPSPHDLFKMAFCINDLAAQLSVKALGHGHRPAVLTAQHVLDMHNVIAVRSLTRSDASLALASRRLSVDHLLPWGIEPPPSLDLQHVLAEFCLDYRVVDIVRIAAQELGALAERGWHATFFAMLFTRSCELDLQLPDRALRMPPLTHGAVRAVYNALRYVSL
jgi:hypothetical protein